MRKGQVGAGGKKGVNRRGKKALLYFSVRFPFSASSQSQMAPARKEERQR